MVVAPLAFDRVVLHKENGDVEACDSLMMRAIDTRPRNRDIPMQELIAPLVSGFLSAPLPARTAAPAIIERGQQALAGRLQGRAARGGTVAPRERARRSRAAPRGGLEVARTLLTDRAA